MLKIRLLRTIGALTDSAKRLNRDILVFLFMLVVSGAFWLLTTLNETYEQEIHIPIKIVNIPRNVVVFENTEDTLVVNVRDKGFYLCSYFFSEPPVVQVNFANYDKQEGEITITNADLVKNVYLQLNSATKVVSVKRDKWQLHYNYGQHKRLPVKFNGRVSVSQSYSYYTTKVSPDSVDVYAASSILAELNSVNTKFFSLSNVADTVKTRVKLDVRKGVKCVPDEVMLTIAPDVLIERTLEVPVICENVPQDKKLRLFPSKVDVHFLVGIGLYRTIGTTQFTVVADYNDVADRQREKCPLKLSKTPNSVKKAKLMVGEVDYLIEER